MGNKSSDDEHDQIISQRRVRIRSSKPAVPSGGIGATLPLMDELSTRASPADVVHEISAGAMKQIGNQLENLNDDLEETFKRIVGRPVSYLCDVMLPTVLYGPICGFLLRLKLPF